MTTATYKIDGERTFPSFIVSGEKLKYLNPEWGYENDGPFTLELPDPRVALIGAEDGRGTTDGSPSFMKFLAISQSPEKRIITAYLVYTFNGPVKVEAWNPEKRGLLEDIDMEHYDITPDRTPDRLLERHYERISHENGIITENLGELAQKTFFDMLWNVDRH